MSTTDDLNAALTALAAATRSINSSATSVVQATDAVNRALAGLSPGPIPPPSGDYINLQQDMAVLDGGPVSFSDGGTTCKVTVRQGDHPSWDSTCDFGGLSVKNADHTPYGATVHLDYTFRIHAGAPINNNAWSLAGEMHADNDVVGRGVSPPIALHVKGDRMQVCWIAGNNASSSKDKWFWSDITVPIVRDHDYHIQIDSKLIQNASTGFLKYRIDGQTIVDYHGIIGYNSTHYYMPDFYREAANETVVLTYSKMKIWVD
jgi:hypothetical protein